MKTKSLTTLATAMLLGTCALAYGQSAAGTAAGAAQTTVESGTNATGAAVSGGATVDAGAQTQADGTTRADATAETEIDLTLDTNGDGTVDADEQAVGDEAAATRQVGQDANAVCSSVDLTAAGEAAQADALALVTSAQVSRLSDCEDGTVGALSAEAQAAVTANEAITRVLEQETVGAGEILGISVEGTTALIYVRDDADETDSTTAQ